MKGIYRGQTSQMKGIYRGQTLRQSDIVDYRAAYFAAKKIPIRHVDEESTKVLKSLFC